MQMAELKYERMLQVKTTGLREWRDPKVLYNRYEATPYKALDRLFQIYKLEKTDQVVDFGCGRGRVSFYIHYHYHVPVTGIEVNDLTFEEAIANKKRYWSKAKHIDAPIEFQYGLAEHYEIDPKDNCFYFFNPFSVKIFKKVVRNILLSVERNQRSVDIILYYPLPEFKHYLKTGTPFQLINKLTVPGMKDKKAKFLIYRYGP